MWIRADILDIFWYMSAKPLAGLYCSDRWIARLIVVLFYVQLVPTGLVLIKLNGSGFW